MRPVLLLQQRSQDCSELIENEVRHMCFGHLEQKREVKLFIALEALELKKLQFYI